MVTSMLLAGCFSLTRVCVRECLTVGLWLLTVHALTIDLRTTRILGSTPSVILCDQLISSWLWHSRA